MNLKNIRKEKMTQQQLADAIGVDRTTIAKIENGSQPSVKTAKAIAKVLNFEQYGLNWTTFFDDKQNGKSA